MQKVQAVSTRAGFASLKRYVDFARSSDVRLPRIVAEIDIITALIKRLVPNLANFLKRSILCVCYFSVWFASAFKLSQMCTVELNRAP